jgi:ribosomal protein S18 acetylase RimI-like enzyme
MEIREAKERDLHGLLQLYTQLHDNAMPEFNEKLNSLWQQIQSDQNHHILIGCEEEAIIASCVVVIIPNLTHNQQPYALIENVITDERFRNRGYGTELLNAAKAIALRENCYKIMLMTGSKKESTLNFYEKAGYNRIDKTAFIQWLP